MEELVARGVHDVFRHGKPAAVLVRVDDLEELAQWSGAEPGLDAHRGVIVQGGRPEAV